MTSTNETIKVEGTSYPVIRLTARKPFEVCGFQMSQGDVFFLVRSKSQVGQYHVVKWIYDLKCWRCSCGAGCKSHSHIALASQYSKSHPYTATHAAMPVFVKFVAPKVDRLQSAMDASELLEEQYEEVEAQEQITATEILNLPFTAPKVAKKVIRMDGDCARQAAFFANLPSRQKIA